MKLNKANWQAGLVVTLDFFSGGVVFDHPPGDRQFFLRFSVVTLINQTNDWIVSQLDRDRFLPNPF